MSCGGSWTADGKAVGNRVGRGGRKRKSKAGSDGQVGFLAGWLKAKTFPSERKRVKALPALWVGVGTAAVPLAASV